jgi:hypothetical protein
MLPGNNRSCLKIKLYGGCIVECMVHQINDALLLTKIQTYEIQNNITPGTYSSSGSNKLCEQKGLRCTAIEL